MKKKQTLVLTGILVVFACFICSLQQCTVVKSLKAIYAEEANYTDFSNGEKSVRFVGMTHFGKKAFYQDVKTIVLEAKESGSVLFYESMGLSRANDVQKRKIRKMMGFVPSPESYQKFTENFDPEKFMVQDDSWFFNLVNDKDFNVDINPQQLIESFEELHGEIQLTEEDWNTPIEEEIEAAFSQSQVQDVILDFRNEYLAEKIMDSQYDKIVVIYGANHQKGLFKSLKKVDKNWKK